MNRSKRLQIAAERLVIAAAAGIGTTAAVAWWRGTAIEGNMVVFPLLFAGLIGMLTFLIYDGSKR